MRIHRLLTVAGLGLVALALSACSGTLPEGFSFDLEAAEAAETEFTAPVEAIGSDAWTIGGLTVAVTPITEISGDPQIGDLVKVHAYTFPDLGLVAREIEPAEAAGLPEADEDDGVPAAGEEIEFVAAVVSMAADSWSIGDWLVAITSDTEIKGAIAVGDLVKVHALVRPDMTLVAREIELAEDDQDDPLDDEHEAADELEFKGVVESIDGPNWTVGGVTFLVTPGTEVKDVIVVGDMVEIEAVWSAEGVLTAVEIHLEDLDDDADDRDDDEDDDEREDDEDEHGDEDDDHGGPGGGSDDN